MLFAGATLSILLAADFARPPGAQISARVAILAIDTYQHWISGHLPLVRCRFAESCSAYAKRSIASQGLAKGVVAAVVRLQQCM